VEYAQKKEKRDISVNLTVVFACVESHGTLHGDHVESPEVSRRLSGVPRGTGWRDRHIIPDGIS